MNFSGHMPRRHFIKASASVAALAALQPGSGIKAAEKLQWPVGCRDLHLKVAGKADSWSCMQALGAECTEVDVALDLSCPNLFHPQRKYALATPEALKVIKEELAASGRRISAFMMSNRFDERLEQELECARRLSQAAQELGVDAIRIDVVPRKLKGDDFLPFAIDACKRLCQTAEGTSVRFGVENHSRVANDPAFLEKLFDGVGSDKLGLTLDTANFYWWGHPLESLYGIYRQFAPRVIHTHCKNIHYPADKQNVRRAMGWEYEKYNCPINEGDIDFKRVVAILREAGYRGDLCVEDESLGKFPENERAAILKKEISLLRSVA